MRRESWSIALACGLGAIIGGFIAKDIGARFAYGQYLWGIGALAGGIISYVAIDFRHFCAGIKRSWDKAIGWKPDRRLVRLRLKAVVAQSYFPAMLTLDAGLIALAISVANGGMLLPTDPVIGSFVISWVIMMLFVSLSITGRGQESSLYYVRRLHRCIDEGKREAWALFPPILFWKLLKIGGKFALALPSVVYEVVTVVVSVISAFLRFLAHVFVYVHSARRTICFVDTAIGVAIGYSYGNVWVGVVAGAILGVINYEIVSVRLLKLAPTR